MKASPESTWSRRRYPVLAGAAVGLVTGLLGLYVTNALYSSPGGGMLGAVGTGVTASYLSGTDLFETLVNAVVADIASSLAFFVLILTGYLTLVWYTEGLSPVEAIWFTVFYTVLGGLVVAAPVAVVSLGVAAVSAAATTLLIHGRELTV